MWRQNESFIQVVAVAQMHVYITHGAKKCMQNSAEVRGRDLALSAPRRDTSARCTRKNNFLHFIIIYT